MQYKLLSVKMTNHPCMTQHMAKLLKFQVSLLSSECTTDIHMLSVMDRTRRNCEQLELDSDKLILVIFFNINEPITTNGLLGLCTGIIFEG